MTISAHLTDFAGRPIASYPEGDRPADPAAVAWRIEDPEFEGEEVFAQRLGDFLAEDWAGQVTTLVVGPWGSVYDTAPPIDVFVAAAARLTGLRALFLGDVTFEQCEISWITQTDITPLLGAYPQLEILAVRGSQGLSLSPVRHESLRSLTFESGGLPAGVVRAVGDCDLPNLDHLELWLGTDNYGGTATVDDLAVILAGSRLPSLTSLGLRDAEIADQVAAAVASAPVVARLQALDLSLGMLTDVGGTALLAGQPLTHLRTLDLHHHYLSVPVTERLRAELRDAGVDLDLSDAGDPDDDDRYIAVSE